MKQKLINSQLTNILTIQSYRRRMCSMAENVLLIKNLPEFIDVGYVNQTLLKTGSIVFFIDAINHSSLKRFLKFSRPIKFQFPIPLV